MKKIMLLCAVLLGLFTSCHEGKESGISYRGGWDRCVNARLVLVYDSIIKGEFWSSDFVGHFNDKISGHYQIEDDSIMIIQWEEAKRTNSVYTKVPLTDTLHICGDTLRRYYGQPYKNRDAYGNEFMSWEHYDLVPER